MEKPVEKQNLSKIALKNSGYTFMSSLIMKIGGLIFTIIIARLLLPELFGIYALTISIVTVISSFTNFGIDQTFLRYLSESLGKRSKQKARAYFKYLLKVKSSLIIIILLLILVGSKFISYTLYDKPLLFYPLIFSCLFIITESLSNFIGSIFAATKNLKPIPPLAVLNQLTRILFSLFAIFLLQDKFKIPGLFIAFGLSGLLHLFLLLLISYKKDPELFLGKAIIIDKKEVWNYIGFISLASMALVFFNSIDILMLGKFVDAEYLGYYRAALGLVLTLSSLFSLSNVLFPIFTQIDKKRFERGFQKTFRVLMIFSVPATLGMIFLSKYLIFTIYGKAYLPAALPLYFLSLLIIIDPLINFYTILFQSKDKQKIIAIVFLILLFVNILLNYFSIKYLLRFGPEYVISGIGVSTVVSRLLLLGVLSLTAKHQFNLRIKGIGLKKSLFAALIMSLFLLIFNMFIDINLFFGIIEVLGGALIYLGVLIIINGATKEDWNLLSSLIKKE